nr:hypothetical protein [Tanacetum cinerariifolium]
MMLDSYMNSMCLKSWGRSNYGRLPIEINACNDFSDYFVMVVPNLKGNRYTKETIRIEYEWKPSHCSTCLIYGHSLVDCLKVAPKRVVNSIDKGKRLTSGADDECFIGETRYEYQVTIKSHQAIMEVYFSWQENGQSFNPIVENINVLEKHILEGKLVFVDDNGKPLEKVDYPDNLGSNNEVEPVENKMASFLASKSIGVGYGLKTCWNNRRKKMWKMATTYMMMICMKVRKFLTNYM